MDLSSLKDCDGARHVPTRVGRGIASGKGKTCGRGMKGQKSRSGVSIKGFEGGQMPIYRRVPKRGFNNMFHKRYATVNLRHIQLAINNNKIDTTSIVDTKAIVNAGIVHNNKLGYGIKILASGTLNTQVTIKVAKASKAAIKAIEIIGGEVILTQSSTDSVIA